jgi:hypothetical protein
VVQSTQDRTAQFLLCIYPVSTFRSAAIDHGKISERPSENNPAAYRPAALPGGPHGEYIYGRATTFESAGRGAICIAHPCSRSSIAIGLPVLIWGFWR